MASQINIRLPDNLIKSAQNYVEEYGYSNIQEFIKETLREKLYEEGEFTYEELNLIKEIKKVSDNKSLYGTEKELFNKIKKLKKE